MSYDIEVGRKEDLGDGAMKQVLAQGREILLARVKDDYYAADNRCPHMGGRLSQGELEGNAVTCPRHGPQFDLRDGRVVRWLLGSRFLSMIGKAIKRPCLLATYDGKTHDDRIMMEIP